MDNKIIWIPAAVCLLVLLGWMFQRRKRWIVNFLLRASSGILAIYAINLLLEWKEIPLGVGINPVTAGVAGVLGAPGIAVLYGIVLYFNM